MNTVTQLCEPTEATWSDQNCQNFKRQQDDSLSRFWYATHIQ